MAVLRYFHYKVIKAWLQNPKCSGSQRLTVGPSHFMWRWGWLKGVTCSWCISLLPVQSSQGSSLNGVFSIMPKCAVANHYITRTHQNRMLLTCSLIWMWLFQMYCNKQREVAYSQVFKAHYSVVLWQETQLLLKVSRGWNPPPQECTMSFGVICRCSLFVHVSAGFKNSKEKKNTDYSVCSVDAYLFFLTFRNRLLLRNFKSHSF